MFVLATAGHVDHGKSTLVRALTGMEPDRFAEERRRGMTIDLGYAWMTLPDDRQLAFVDVPGHQRFIANMLAGLGPSPAVLFVVAADEGWSRQSTEHLAAIDALDVRYGVLAVTRSDLADPGPAIAQAQAELAASSLGSVEAVAVSGTTGVGLGQLRDALGRLVAALPAPRADGPVRLWLDRSFSIRGSGTVVTGTLGSGLVTEGDRLAIDGGVDVVVRGVQTTGVARKSARAVSRVALNLRGVATADIGRGDVLLTPGEWWRATQLDVRLSTGDRLPSQLVLHVGTTAVPVQLRPLAGPIVRLTLSRPLPLRAGDRAVLRDPGRQAVAAGVLVLDADPPTLSRRGAPRRRAADLTVATGIPELRVEVARRGVVARQHLELLGVDTSGVVDVSGWVIDPDARDELTRRAPIVVDSWAASHPLDPAMPRTVLARELGVPTDVVGTLARAAGLHLEAGRVRKPGAPADLGRAEPAVRTVLEQLRAHPFAAPDRDALSALGLGTREIGAAVRSGRLLRVGPDIVLLPDAPGRAVEVLRNLSQPFTTSTARQALGTTRRVVIPLLEHLDSLGLTERIGDGLRRTS